jgi:hypothetical protein
MNTTLSFSKMCDNYTTKMKYVNEYLLMIEWKHDLFLQE